MDEPKVQLGDFSEINNALIFPLRLPIISYAPRQPPTISNSYKSIFDFLVRDPGIL